MDSPVCRSIRMCCTGDFFHFLSKQKMYRDQHSFAAGHASAPCRCHAHQRICSSGMSYARLHFFRIYAGAAVPLPASFIRILRAPEPRRGNTGRTDVTAKPARFRMLLYPALGFFLCPHCRDLTEKEILNCKFYDPKEVNYEKPIPFTSNRMEKTSPFHNTFDFRLRRDSDRCVCLCC